MTRISFFNRPAWTLVLSMLSITAASGCCSQCTGLKEEGSLRSSARVALDISIAGRPAGQLVFELDYDKAPETSANFVQYMNDRYFDGTIIHRVTTGPRIHVLQGGGYTALNAPSKPGQRKPIKNEATNGLKNLRGTIAMARDAAPHTATSEFFVNLKDNPSLDYPGRDGWGYCVFGRIVAGEDVLDRIAAIETRVNPDPVLRGEKSQPIDPPVVIKAHLVKHSN